MSPQLSLSFVNLDDPASASTVIAVDFRGVKVTITKDKLLQLLQLEQQVLETMIAGGAANESFTPGSAPTVATVERVGHSSLSNRITKLLRHSAANNDTMRPTHLQVLSDLLDGFDWRIPLHAHNRVPTMLRELLKRKGFTQEMRKKIGTFMVRYEASRPGG